MLNFIRERAQGWVAWFIVGLISIPFALWGVNSYLTGPSDAVTATVNGETIKQYEFQKAFQQYRDRMRQAMGESFDPSLIEGPAVKQTVLDGLIERKLLELANEELGQRISNSAVSAFIQATPAFQTEGKFDQERYRMLLARIGESPASYEAQLRLDMLARELTDNVEQSVLVSNSEVEQILQLEKQSRDIAYGIVSAQALVSGIEVSDQEVQDYFDINKAKYMAPERVSVDYIELSVDELSKDIEVTEQALQQYYLENQSQFVGPEQRRASHILIEGDETEALATIAKIQERLSAGDAFADLAKEYSQDAGSAIDGGDLGYFGKDVMDPAFEEAVFALTEVGQITEAVKSEFGYHLIELTDIKQPEGKSFDQARDEIENKYRLREAETVFFEQAEELADLSYENPDSLDYTAETMGLTIQTSDEFTRDGGAGIASDKKVIGAAFSEDVLINNLNSAVLELSKNRLVVIHKNKHTMASQIPLESIAPAIAEQLKFEKASQLAKQQGDEILAKLKAGDSAVSLFAENDWHDTQTYSRIEETVSAQVLENAFKVPEPAAGAAEYTTFSAANGNYIIVKVSAVNAGDATSVSEQDRKGLENYLSQTSGSSEVQAFIDSLRADAEIEIFPENLK